MSFHSRSIIKAEKVEQALREACMQDAARDLLSIAKRWNALDGGAWHPERHANEKERLIVDTRAAIAKAEGRS